MKVKFKYGIKTYSGTLEEMTYGSFRDDNLCIGRQWVMPELTVQNSSIGAIMKNLSAVYQEALPAYRADMKIYSRLNGAQNISKKQLVPTAFAIFVKTMFAWRETNPSSIDLSSITVEDIVSQPAPVISVANAMNSGLMAEVEGGDSLTADMG